MSGQTATRTRFSIRWSDQCILRELAKQVAELSAHPIEQVKRERWYRHNASSFVIPKTAGTSGTILSGWYAGFR